VSSFIRPTIQFKQFILEYNGVKDCYASCLVVNKQTIHYFDGAKASQYLGRVIYRYVNLVEKL